MTSARGGILGAMPNPTFSRTIQASWRLVFTALALQVLSLAVAVLWATDEAAHTTAVRSVSAALSASLVGCYALLYRRVKTGWIPRHR